MVSARKLDGNLGVRYMVRIMCGVQLKWRDRAYDLVGVFGLNETMDQLSMVTV